MVAKGQYISTQTTLQLNAMYMKECRIWLHWIMQRSLCLINDLDTGVAEIVKTGYVEQKRR
jgi:hypothetical protein